MKKQSEEIKGYSKDVIDILEQLTDAFLLVDSDFTVTYLNKEAEKLARKTKPEIIGKNLWELFPGLAKGEAYVQYSKALKQGHAVRFETQYTPMDLCLEINTYPTKSGLSIFLKNITERKQTEEKLQQLSLIAKETINAVSMATREGKIIWVNEAYTNITGYTFEEAIGRKNSELLFGPDSNPNVVKYMKESFARGEPFQGEVLCYTKTKQKIWIEASGQPVYNKEGKLQQYFIIQTNITERKKIEEELQKLSLVAKETQDAVVLFNMDRTVTWANEAFTRMTEFSLNEVLGRRLREFIRGPLTNLQTIEQLQQSWDRLELFQCENIYYTKSKKKLYTELSLQPLLDNWGNPEQMFMVMRDVSEKKELQKKITTAVIKTQEKERELVGQELHDNVNQVLTTVKLYTELCRDGIGNSQELMDKSIKLLNNSINEIRSLSKRLSAPSLGKIGLKESVKELVEAIEATHKLSITLDASAIEKFDADQELHLAVYRILQEQLTNILKHAGATNAEITFKKTPGYLLLIIEDNGKGFEVDKKRKGVGITNMVSRAESLNGTLTIKSASGEGCTLIVSLPIM